MLPALTDKAIAPEELLKVIRCDCKAECQTSRCSCEKHGQVYTTGCGECRGPWVICTNSVNQTVFVGDYYD